jgi:tRNA pseudouridine55 synthase
MDITCSPGTYIRSLARDLGQAAGTGAHLAKLTRTASGDWSLAKAVSLDILEREAANDSSNWRTYLFPPDQAVHHLPPVTLDKASTECVRHGQQIQILSAAGRKDELIRAYTPTGDFLAILTQVKAGDKLWQPRKVFHTPI